MLLFFSVARFAHNDQAERASTGQTEDADAATAFGEPEQTAADTLVDVSAEALRMSSPFNAGYWQDSPEKRDEHGAAA